MQATTAPCEDDCDLGTTVNNIDTIRFDFLRWVRHAAILSCVAIVLSIGLLATRGLNFGLDFTGGFLIEVGYDQPADLDNLRGALGRGGFEDAQVQHFGSATEVLVRLAPPEDEGTADVSSDVLDALSLAGGDPTMKRVEFVYRLLAQRHHRGVRPHSREFPSAGIR